MGKLESLPYKAALQLDDAISTQVWPGPDAIMGMFGYSVAQAIIGIMAGPGNNEAGMATAVKQ
jgi:hypothetical protein